MRDIHGSTVCCIYYEATSTLIYGKCIQPGRVWRALTNPITNLRPHRSRFSIHWIVTQKKQLTYRSCFVNNTIVSCNIWNIVCEMLVLHLTPLGYLLIVGIKHKSRNGLVLFNINKKHLTVYIKRSLFCLFKICHFEMPIALVLIHRENFKWSMYNFLD